MVKRIEDLDANKHYTYADYLTWQFDEWVELIKGKVFKMSPAPNITHQRISFQLGGIIWSYLKDKDCQAFQAPCDVRLSTAAAVKNPLEMDTVVQPDLFVLCDLSKLEQQICNGAPDWIIEILSKSTAAKDLKVKFELYQAAGVHEYWVVYPAEEAIQSYVLDQQGIYQHVRKTAFVKGEKIPVQIFPDFYVDLDEVFKN